MSENLVYRVGDWVKSFLGTDNQIQPPGQTMEEMVNEARLQWQAAAQYFQEVCDPELVDYAILSLDAAEKRYNYLLRKVKES